MNEEHFDAFLDNIVAGATAPDPDPLARFASQVHEQEPDRLADDRRRAIWRNLMAAHTHDTPTTGGAGPLSQLALTEPDAFNPWVLRGILPEPKRSRMGIVNNGIQVSISALAVVAIVIAAIVAFPVMRGDHSPEITPTAFAAAPTLTSRGNNRGVMSPTLGTPDNGQGMEWLTYIRSSECTVEPVDSGFSIDSLIPGSYPERKYTPVTAPSAEDAEMVTQAARQVVACDMNGAEGLQQALGTERYNDSLTGGLFSRPEDPADVDDLEAALAILPYLPQEPDAYRHVTTETATNDRWDIFLPNQAIELPDGRIAIPSNVLYQELPDDLPATVHPIVYIFENQNDTWLLDQQVIRICIGPCDEIWSNALLKDEEASATPQMKASSTASTPFATPEPSVTYRHPQATDCKVDPLTVDEVMAILEGKPSDRAGSADPLPNLGMMDEETYTALADAQREWLACRIHGSPFQTWALESDELIRTDLRQTYFPHYNLEGIREDLVQMRSETSDADTNAGITWDPPADTYIPMVPEYDANVLPMSGNATLPITWMNRDGDVIPIPGADNGAPVRSLESHLPNVWAFVRDEASGRWLLDGHGMQWGVTSTSLPSGDDAQDLPLPTVHPVQPLPSETPEAPSPNDSMPPTTLPSGGDVRGSSQPTVHPVQPLSPTVTPEPTSTR